MRKIRFLALYIPVSLLFVFIISEIVIRVYFSSTHRDIKVFRPSFFYKTYDLQNDRRRFKSHPFMPFAPRPNDSRVIYNYKPDIDRVLSYDYTNNSLGFRTPERAFKKPSNTKRIIILGGSTAWDGPTNDKTWPALLEKKLNEHYRDNNISVQVINLAMDGATSIMSLTVLNLFGVHYEPDLVVSYDGVNDLGPARYWKDVVPDYSNYLRSFNENVKSYQMMLPKWAFNSYVVSVLTSGLDKTFNIKTNLIDQIWILPPTSPTDKTVDSGLELYFRNLKLMRGTCLEYNCKFVASIAHWAVIDDYLQIYDKRVRDFLKDEKFNYLDLQSKLPHNDYNIHSDLVHWTQKGLEMVADEWAQKIINDELIYTSTDKTTGSTRGEARFLVCIVRPIG